MSFFHPSLRFFILGTPTKKVLEKSEGLCSLEDQATKLKLHGGQGLFFEAVGTKALQHLAHTIHCIGWSLGDKGEMSFPKHSETHVSGSHNLLLIVGDKLIPLGK